MMNRRLSDARRDRWLAGRARLVTSAVVVAALIGMVGAHASLQASEPTADAVVAQPLESVTLTFTEAVEVAFSSFKVYRIDAEVDMSSANASMRLNALAALLVTDFNGQGDDGEGKVVSTVLAPTGDATSVTLQFEGSVPAGHYVVMWRVLSVDTHVIDGHLVFTVTTE